MKKTLSVCLALLMLLSCFAVPTTAFAAAPKKTTVSSVSAGAAAFTVKWKKVSGVTGYQVQYSTSSKFDKKVTKALKVTNGNATAASITGLKGGKKYYVRVQAYVNQGKKSYSGAYSAAKTVTTAKDPFKKGKYAGVQLNTTADAVRYYVKAYNATKKETAKYQNKETDEILTYYKLLGVKTLSADNVYINGGRNKFMDSYLDSMISDTKVGTGLPPCTAVEKSEDTDLNGKSLVTSRLRDTDVETLSIKDNKNGTVTLTIKPKSVQTSSPGTDPQGRFFTTAGPMYDAIDKAIKENGGKWTTGNAKKNVTMNYTGGTGTITINTSTGKITKAKYNMIVKAEIRNITLSGQKFKSIAMDCSKVDTFPATGSNFADWGMALV